MGMAEGTAYDVEWVEMSNKIAYQEAIDSVAVGFKELRISTGEEVLRLTSEHYSSV